MAEKLKKLRIGKKNIPFINQSEDIILIQDVINIYIPIIISEILKSHYNHHQCLLKSCSESLETFPATILSTTQFPWTIERLSNI